MTIDRDELRERIGFDAGSACLEDALDWSAAHEFHYVDFNADIGPNRLDQWPDGRLRQIRTFCNSHGIHLGLHTLSAVNIAELSPVMAPAADQYLEANITLAKRLECEWITVHAGYHFSSTIKARQDAALERLRRAAELARDAGQRLLLENLNFEPNDAEVHYLAHNVAECRTFFEGIASEAFGWAFTANHANLVPEGIDGFLDAFGTERIGCVRLADNDGAVEVHKIPGEGNIDFGALFRRLEGDGYRGHYTMAYGSDDDKLASREWLLDRAVT